MAIFKIKPQKTTTINTMTGTQIYQELGGNDFAWLSGCTNFVSGANYLSMRLPKNKKGSTHLKIESNQKETFDLVFVKIVDTKLTAVKRVQCPWFALKSRFTQLTGLCTSVAG